jgi:hypothetical protein
VGWGRWLGAGLVLAGALTTRASVGALRFPAFPWSPISLQASLESAGIRAPEPPAIRYGRLGRNQCLSELTARGVQFSQVGETPGVLAPIRLLAPLHGVTYRTALPASKRQSSPWEIVDCRLALALDDFAAQLSSHDIVEVVHFSMYRPPSRHWPADRLASRHPGALAIDAESFVKRDGSTLVVERDFHGRVGAKTCEVDAWRPSAQPESTELHQIVCDAADAKLFNVALTPDYNRAHWNHFHLEVTAGAQWFFVH